MMHRWMWPALAAVLLFAGNLAANWVGSGPEMEAFVERFRPWLWALIGIALVLTVVLAVVEARRPAPGGTRQKVKLENSPATRVDIEQAGEGEQEFAAKDSKLEDVNVRQG